MSECSCTFHDFFSPNLYTWCTNCGNYGIHAAVKRALVAECIEPQDTLLCFDIGCNGNGSDKIGGYRYHGLHGRVLPLAAGASVANRRIKVLAFAGDGGTLGEGINHLIHSVRGNFDVTFILHNNSNYGLTQGQASPTTPKNVPMNASPEGVTSEPIHPMRLVMSLQPSFAARSFSGDVKHMTSVIQQALQHKGFSFVEILQHCPTYNKSTPHEWYQQRVVKVEEMAGYDKHDLPAARKIAEDLTEQIALGVLYQAKDRPDFMGLQGPRQGKETELVDEVKAQTVSRLLAQFK
jgi:2-oxoglutarate/2-oxoacid ferredoxin oxidoreductase subunit beta